MSDIDWKAKLGWNDEQLEDLRMAGYAYIRQGKYEISLPFFEALTILDPLNAYDAQTLGALFLQMGKADRAKKYLEKALKLEANHPPTLLNLAKALFMLGKREEGLRLAHLLIHDEDKAIADMARALLLAFT